MTGRADSQADPTTIPASPEVPFNVRFDTEPDRYRHWKLEVDPIDPEVAHLRLDIAEDGGLAAERADSPSTSRPRMSRRS